MSVRLCRVVAHRMAALVSGPCFAVRAAEVLAAGLATEKDFGMTTYITHIRMSPPNASDHQHISEVRWSQPGSSGECNRAAMVEFIDTGEAVFVHATPGAHVGVVHVDPPYLRTHADGVWTNNLLSLPRF